MLIIKKWRSDFVLNSFISTFDILIIDFLFITHTGGDIQNATHSRL